MLLLAYHFRVVFTWENNAALVEFWLLILVVYTVLANATSHTLRHPLAFPMHSSPPGQCGECEHLQGLTVLPLVAMVATPITCSLPLGQQTASLVPQEAGVT